MEIQRLRLAKGEREPRDRTDDHASPREPTGCSQLAMLTIREVCASSGHVGEEPLFEESPLHVQRFSGHASTTKHGRLLVPSNKKVVLLLNQSQVSGWSRLHFQGEGGQDFIGRLEVRVLRRVPGCMSSGISAEVGNGGGVAALDSACSAVCKASTSSPPSDSAPSGSTHPTRRNAATNGQSKGIREQDSRRCGLDFIVRDMGSIART